MNGEGEKTLGAGRRYRPLSLSAGNLTHTTLTGNKSLNSFLLASSGNRGRVAINHLQLHRLRRHRDRANDRSVTALKQFCYRIYSLQMRRNLRNVQRPRTDRWTGRFTSVFRGEKSINYNFHSIQFVSSGQIDVKRRKLRQPMTQLPNEAGRGLKSALASLLDEVEGGKGVRNEHWWFSMA